MAEHATVIRVAHFPVASDKRSQLVAQLNKLAEQARGMEGCFGMSICTVRESSNEVVAVSRWASQSALEKMTQSGISDSPEVRGILNGSVRLEHFEVA